MGERGDEMRRVWEPYPGAFDHLADCCVCGGAVDMREAEDGGDVAGCQLDDGRWVCSRECWASAIGEAKT